MWPETLNSAMSAMLPSPGVRTNTHKYCSLTCMKYEAAPTVLLTSMKNLSGDAGKDSSM